MNYFKYLVIIVSLATVGCRYSHSHDDHSHSHDGHSHGQSDHSHEGIVLEKVQYTAYSADFEIFAESDPFIVDEPSAILVHLTSLRNFKPLDGGAVTATLVVNGKEISHTVENPVRKGIYTLSITPNAEGEGQLFVSIGPNGQSARIALGNVVVHGCAHSASDAHRHEELPTVNTIVFTKEQSWKIDFATEQPAVQPFGQVIKTTARVLPAASDELVITAKARGVVLMNSGAVLAGSSVRSGVTLLTIGSTGIAEESSAVVYAEAKNAHEKALADYARAQELAKDRIISGKDLLQAKVDYENARVRFESIGGGYGEAGLAVRSNLDGYVSQVYVSNGQFVEVGQPLVSVIRNRHIYLRADVRARYASVLGAIKSANIRALPSGSVYTLEELNGRVVSYGKSTETDGFLLPVTLQVENNGHFVPGTFVEVYLKSETSGQALTIPTSAILEEQGSFSVLVQLTPELFERREVRPGVTDGVRTEILGGISAANRVVTRGAILVKLAQASAALDPHAGHVH